jgi:hypothetical protein
VPALNCPIKLHACLGPVYVAYTAQCCMPVSAQHTYPSICHEYGSEPSARTPHLLQWQSSTLYVAAISKWWLCGSACWLAHVATLLCAEPDAERQSKQGLHLLLVKCSHWMWHYATGSGLMQ